MAIRSSYFLYQRSLRQELYNNLFKVVFEIDNANSGFMVGDRVIDLPWCDPEQPISLVREDICI